ncbi:TraR/DksA family transcriptional regulator [Streptomyces sp. WSLK1-3]|uniref:TraR/DksA family transcriptional regulator n=1 Tax=Streptomyces sp. WSLK1-3 TaxID=3375475 RepID=UPI003799E49B
MNHPTIDDRNTALTIEDIAALRENLHEQRLFRREQLKQLTADDLPEGLIPEGLASEGLPPKTLASEGLEPEALAPERLGAAHLQVRVQLAASARMVLTDVEAALDRMDRGTYGACHLCRGPIARERLMIVPQARFCARCQQVREAYR